MSAQDDGLREWRRTATHIVLAAAVLLHLPVLILFLGGYGPPLVWRFRVPILVIFIVAAANAMARRVPHPIRVWVMLGALYSIALLGVFILPQGPWVRTLPVAAPILAIALIGVGAARAAMVVSAFVMLAGPFLHDIPLINRALGLDADAGMPAGQILLQNIALTADMIVLMILLESFSGFLLAALARQRWAAAERTAASRKLEDEIEERRRLQNEITRVGDEERRHLGQEVHDGVCQQITAALLRCQALELRLERGTSPTTDELRALSALLADTIHEAHAVAKGLCPLQPDPGALAPALRELAKRSEQASGIECRFVSAGDVLVPDTTAAHHLYRVAQEAVSNAMQHAHATRIAIELKGGDDELELRVDDDGAGLPETLPRGGMGLRTMGFRAQIIEGQLAVDSTPGGGTHVSCRVPRTAVSRPSPRATDIRGQGLPA